MWLLISYKLSYVNLLSLNFTQAQVLTTAMQDRLTKEVWEFIHSLLGQFVEKYSILKHLKITGLD